MEFRINKIPFLNFNWQYEKELHNKEGKPNQKCGCYFETSKLYDFQITKEWEDIITLTDEKLYGKADELEFDEKTKHFKGNLSKDLSLFSGPKRQKKASSSLYLEFEFNGRKTFKKLYKNKIINIIFKDISKLDKLNNLPKGNITFNIKFIDKSLAPTAIPLLSNFTINEDGESFTIKTDDSILDLEIDNTIDHIECDNLYVIDKNKNNWKYKIDVQNYLYLLGKCDYKETDDLDVKFEFKYKGKTIKKPTWEIFKSNLIFKVNTSRKFVYNIIKNNSLENPYDKNPFKECKDGKSYKGKKFVLDEELPVGITYDIVLGRKK